MADASLPSSSHGKFMMLLCLALKWRVLPIHWLVFHIAKHLSSAQIWLIWSLSWSHSNAGEFGLLEISSVKGHWCGFMLSVFFKAPHLSQQQERDQETLTNRESSSLPLGLLWGLCSLLHIAAVSCDCHAQKSGTCKAGTWKSSTGGGEVMSYIWDFLIQGYVCLCKTVPKELTTWRKKSYFT